MEKNYFNLALQTAIRDHADIKTDISNKNLKKLTAVLSEKDNATKPEYIDAFVELASIIIFPPTTKNQNHRLTLTKMRDLYNNAREILMQIQVNYESEDFMTQVKLYAELSDIKKNYDEKAKQAKAIMDQIMPVLYKYFEDNGIDHLRVGNRTVYLYKQIYASRKEDADPEQAIKALKDYDLEWLVKENFNASQLASWYRDQEIESQDDLPEELKEFFNVVEKFDIRVRK